MANALKLIFIPIDRLRPSYEKSFLKLSISVENTPKCFYNVINIPSFSFSSKAALLIQNILKVKSKERKINILPIVTVSDTILCKLILNGVLY
jgi:hypothetical protein